MKDWVKKGKKIAAGKWLRFDADTPKHIVTFVGEPEVVTKVSQMGPSKGEEYEQLSFPVEEEGDAKILEPNKSLLRLLIEEEEDESIIGRTFEIKCLDTQRKQTWKIREVAGETLRKQWTKEEPSEEEEEEEKPKRKPRAKKVDKEKEKFMEEVHKRMERQADERMEDEPEVGDSEEFAGDGEESQIEEE